MIKLSTITHLVVLSLLLSVSAARAEDNEKSRACRADVAKLCKGIQPGGGRITMCLKQHESELSPGCRETIAEAKEQIKEFAEACRPDAEKLCKGVQPGQGRVARCLVGHRDQLSAGCREKIAPLPDLSREGRGSNVNYQFSTRIHERRMSFLKGVC